MSDPVFVILLVNREDLGKPIRLVAENRYRSPVVTTSLQRARTFGTARQAENYRLKLDRRIGNKGSFLRDDDPDKPELYMTVVEAVERPPAKRPPRPKRELPPPLPLVWE